MTDAERIAMAESYGYEQPRIMPDGSLAALGRQIYTTGIVLGIDDSGYAARFCYGSYAVAAAALKAWDGNGDPPGPWIKYKGRGGERLGPGALDTSLERVTAPRQGARLTKHHRTLAMNDTAQVTIGINSTLGKRAADEVDGLEAKVKASMRAVIRENWMETDEDALMRAGIGGALLSVGKDSPDYKRIVDSVEMLRKFAAALNAMQSGVSVNLDSALR